MLFAVQAYQKLATYSVDIPGLSPSALDANKRLQLGDLARQTGAVGGIDHHGDVLVRTRRFFGDATRRR